jgi:peroxiredoxin
MFGFGRYNHERFTSEMLKREMLAGFPGPEPGDRAPDFEARTLEGDKVRLSAYRGRKNVVLTFGSVTCPATAASIGGMNELYDHFAGDEVEFLLVYVREAHPGELIPAHESLEHKAASAEILREEEGVEMPIIVDDIRGTIHRRYAKLPNPTYVIDRAGRIAFRAKYTRPEVIGDALEELLERQRERGVEHAIVAGGEDTAMPKLRPLLHAYRAVERGGEMALRDFRDAIGMPGRVMLAASRRVEPIALHPGKTLTGVALAAAVVTGALLAGRELRQRRYREPYDVHRPKRRRRPVEGDSDYEAVGI